ncbi:MAG: exopolysaccharide biosynthesis protein [Chlamydiota bacterium]
MKKTTVQNVPFTDALKHILKTPHAVSIKEILSILAKHGHATLLLIFSLPLCFPIQIPGLSTPFGLLLCLIGIQMGFTKRLWLPKWILQKKIPKKVLQKITEKIISISLFLERFLHPRLETLTQSITFVRLNGSLIAILALFLALPLPIPMTNFFSALPIIALALGILEDDGICILVGYFLSLVCFSFFFYLAYFGISEIKHLTERFL